MNIFNTIIRTAIRTATARYTNKGLDHLERGGCGSCLSQLGTIVILCLMGWCGWRVFNKDKKLPVAVTVPISVWDKVKVGDSLFFDQREEITFYKKGKTMLNQQEKTKKGNQDTVNYLAQNTLDKRVFEFVGTSFVGICTGKDSTKTTEGEPFKHQWLKVKPNAVLTQPPKKKNKKSVSWLWKNKNVDKRSPVPLKDDFYVRVVDIRSTENEK